MAKVLFIMKYPLVDAYSVKNKFNGQIAAVDDMGHDVYYVAYDKKHTYLVHRGEKTIIKNIWFGNWSMYIHTKAFFDLFNSVCRVLKKENFDIAYIRHCPLSYGGYRMFRKLKENGSKLIVEIPTYPASREKQPTVLRSLYMRYSSYWWNKVHSLLNLYTLIGDKADYIGQIPAQNIDNGTDVNLLPLREPKPETDKVHLLALASMSYWHGYDRLIRGIAALPKEERDTVILDMVGDEGAALSEWKVLAKELQVEEQVLFHGRKTGAELDPFFDVADLGICSLGFCRINFTSGSILKLREYTSRGLPFVYAAEDPAIDAPQPFCMKVPNDESVVDVHSMIAFAKEMREHPDMPTKMRQYANERMTWQSQFEKVFNKLKELEQ